MRAAFARLHNLQDPDNVVRFEISIRPTATDSKILHLFRKRWLVADAGELHCQSVMQSTGFKREPNSAGNVHLMIQRLNHEIHELIERKNHTGAHDEKVAQLICQRKENFSKLRCTRYLSGK